MFLRDCGVVDPGYMIDLSRRLVKVVRKALAVQKPAVLRAGKLSVNGVSYNRRRLDGPLDTELQVLRIDGTDGSTLAVLLNYACHPVTSGPDNRLTSADFPGVVLRLFEAQTGSVALFTNGACGDINPVGDLVPKGDYPNHFALAQTLGSTLFEAAFSVWEKLVPLDSAPIQLHRRNLHLPLQACPDEKELCSLATQYAINIVTAAREMNDVHYRLEAAMLDWVMATVEAMRLGELKTEVQAEVQTLRIGDVSLVGVPAELFARLGQDIKQQAHTPFTFVSTYTNGNVGYIPTREEYPYCGYEVAEAYRYYGYPAAVAPEAGEMIVEAAVELANGP